jgi:hypothetical protein
MSASLLARQRALVEALQGRQSAGDIGLRGLQGLHAIKGEGPGLERGLLAYRLNAQALATRSLGAVFARIEQHLGEASFAAMAWSFWRLYPPEQGDLGLWGEELPVFLAEQEGMTQWLIDLARLEWAAHACERAADSELDAASLSRLSDVEPAHLALRFRPGLCLLEVTSAAWSLWCDLEPDFDAESSVYVAIARKVWRSEAHSLQAGEWSLMTALSAGKDLEQALLAAFEAQADFDFAAWLQNALMHGWLLAAESLAQSE